MWVVDGVGNWVVGCCTKRGTLLLVVVDWAERYNAQEVDMLEALLHWVKWVDEVCIHRAVAAYNLQWCVVEVQMQRVEVLVELPRVALVMDAGEGKPVVLAAVAVPGSEVVCDGIKQAAGVAR